MKRICLGLYFLLFIIIEISAQQQKVDGNNIKQLMEIEWNTEDGIELKDYPEGRTGIADYDIISNDEVAFLCNVEKKIKIFNVETGLISNQFSINHYPSKLTYESIKQRFYILDYFDKVYEYFLDGTLISSFEINQDFKFLERLESFNGNVYLLSANQNTFQLTNNGIILGTDEQLQSRVTGWILNKNVYGRTNIKDAHTYTVEIRNKSTVVISKDFSTSERIDVGTIRLIGSSGKLFYLMLDYVLPKNPTRAGRRLLVFSRETESIIQQFDLPNINYSVVHNDVKAFGEQLFHLLLTPQNAVLFEPFYESFINKVYYPDKYNYEYFDNNEPDDSSPLEQIEIHENNSDTLKQQGNTDSIEHSLFKIKYEHNRIIDSRGHDIGTTKLHFKNKTIELTDNELFRISQNGQIAAIKDFFCSKDDTINKLTLYDTNGIAIRQFEVPATPASHYIGNNGAFALYGPKPSRMSLAKGYIDTTGLLLFNPVGELIHKDDRGFGGYSFTFSESGNVFVFLTRIFKETNTESATLLIFTEINTSPKYVTVDVDNWPLRASVADNLISIDERNKILIIHRRRTYLDSLGFVDLVKETLFYDFKGIFIKLEKGWTL